MHINQILLSSKRLELSPWSFTHVFKKIETTLRWNCMSKALRFLQITAEHQDCPFFVVFLTTNSLPQNNSIALLQISLKLHEHRGRYWRKKLPWTILEEQFPVPRYNAASNIGNTSFRCYDNSDAVASLIISNFHLHLIQLWWQFFQNFVYGDVVDAQTWEVLTLKIFIEPT